MDLWQSTDAQRLKQLRLARAMDTLSLAQQAAISEQQLLELEGQAKGQFYTEAIKRQTGQRLLRLLGDTATTDAGPLVVAPTTKMPAGRLVEGVAPATENPKLLLHIGVAFVLAGLLISTVNLLDGLGLRPGGSVMLVLGLAMLVLIKFGQTNLAIISFCIGCLSLNFLSSLTIRGLNNISWVAVPIGTMAAGWFLGRKAAWLMAGMGTINAILIYWLHTHGSAFAENMPAESLLTGWIVSFGIAALIGAVTSQTFLRQYDLIKESKAELNAVVDSSRAMIWSVSKEDFALRTFNKCFEQEILSQLGIQPVQGMLPEQVFGSERTTSRWRSLYLEAVEKDGVALEDVLLGSDRIFEILINAIRLGKQVVGLSVYAQDITERKQAAQQIEFLAYCDTLTGLPNRTAAYQRIRKAVARSVKRRGHLALLSLNIDEFKNINDAYGNQVGDAFLKLTATRIHEQTTENETLFRTSSDEFLVLMEHQGSVQEVTELCERIRSEVRQPADIQALKIRASLCIGVALLEPGKELSAEALIANANLALHEAKKLGAGTFCFFSHKMTQELQDYLETRDALSRAIHQGEFELYFQPLVCLKTSRVLGAEALIRWNHPGKGLLSPAHFIPIAEKSGQIIEISHWVLSSACQTAAKWPMVNGESLTVAVNLSPTHFSRGEVLKDVREALATSKLSPDRLELELTESVLMDTDENIRDSLAELRSMGVRIAVDDFGTGYSSLAYLQRLPIDKIKLDRQFIHSIDSDPATRTIVNALISIAHGLQLEILAEGIESGDVMRLLEQAGCDQAQGFHIAAPMPSEKYLQWLLSGHPS